MKIAYLGPEGSYHSIVADNLIERFGGEKLPYGTPAELLSVAAGMDVDYSLIAVETNLLGMIEPHLREFLNADLEICGEVAYEAHMSLVGMPGTELENITRVHSHPEALAECRTWLRAHLPNASIAFTGSTSAGAHAAMIPGGQDAAICSPDTAEKIGLMQLVNDVCDEPGDVTRFWLMGRRNELELPLARSSLLITSHHSDKSETLLHLASAPMPIERVDAVTQRTRLGDYSLYVDIQRNPNDEFEALLKDLTRIAHVRHLGTYADISA